MPVMPGPSLSFLWLPTHIAKSAWSWGNPRRWIMWPKLPGNDNLAPTNHLCTPHTLQFSREIQHESLEKLYYFYNKDFCEHLSSISGSLMVNHECIWWSEGRWCCFFDEFTQTGRSRQCFVTKSNIRLEPTSSLERPKTGRVGKVAKQYHQKLAWNESWFLKQNVSWKTPG